MKCPKCQTEDTGARKFYWECGEKSLLICSRCNAENIPGDNFFGEWDHNLILPPEQPAKELSFDDKLNEIQRYLPKGFY